MGAGGGVSAAQPWGPQWGGQRAASPPSAMRWGHPGAKTPPPTPPPTPPRARRRPPPCPSLPGTVTARPLFAKGVLFCPSRCQQSSQGMGGGHRKGCGTRPPDPPKGTPLGCQHQHYTAVWPPDPKRSGGLWLPSQPQVCPHPSPGGVRGVPTQCEVPGGGSTGPGTGIVHSGDSGQCGWHCTTGTTMAQRGGRDGMGAVVANHGGCGGTGTTTAHHEGCDGAPWGP